VQEPPAYLEWSARSEMQARRRYALKLLSLLPAGARVLELGSGAGYPVTHVLAQRFAVRAVEKEARALALARVNVPAAQFVAGDWTRVRQAREGFDAVVAMYVLSLLARRALLPQLKRVARWLRPKGLLVGNRHVAVEGPIEQAWPGAPVIFTHVDAGEVLAAVGRAGLEPVESEVISDEDARGRPISFLWFIARKLG
jgi:SAM-dependent methyltransferase